jgi:hypothetical protein
LKEIISREGVKNVFSQMSSNSGTVEQHSTHILRWRVRNQPSGTGKNKMGYILLIFKGRQFKSKRKIVHNRQTG